MEDESKTHNISQNAGTDFESMQIRRSQQGTHNISQNVGTDFESVQVLHSQQGTHNIGQQNAVIDPMSVQNPQSQQGIRNIGHNATINPETETVRLPSDQEEARNVVHNEGNNGSAPLLPMTFIELAAYAGVSAGISSALLSFLQLSRTDGHKPFQSHYIVSLITVGVLVSIIVGLCVAAIIQHREQLRGLYVHLCYIMYALTLISCALVVVLLCLP